MGVEVRRPGEVWLPFCTKEARWMSLAPSHGLSLKSRPPCRVLGRQTGGDLPKEEVDFKPLSPAAQFSYLHV